MRWANWLVLWLNLSFLLANVWAFLGLRHTEMKERRAELAKLHRTLSEEKSAPTVRETFSRKTGD